MTAIQDNLKQLAEMSRLLETAVYDMEQLNEAYVIAKNEWKKAYARTFLSLDGSMELRRQQAILDTADIELDMEIAEVRKDACRERIRMLGSQIEVARSINAALQKQWMAEPVGQYT